MTPAAQSAPAVPWSAPWSVALPLPVPAYDFAALHGFSGAVPIGCRVLVPWRGELQVGVVVGPGEAGSAARLREAVALLDPPGRPHVSPGFVAAALELAALARLPLGLVVSDFVGVGWQPPLHHRVRAVAGADLTMFGESAPGPDWQDAVGLDPALLDHVRAQGLLDERVEPARRQVSGYRANPPEAVPPQHRTEVVWAANVEGDAELSGRQRVAHDWLRQHGPAASLSAWARGAGVSAALVNAVLARGWAGQLGRPAPPPAAWTVLREAGFLPSQVVWAQAAGVPPSEVARLIARGWAGPGTADAPPPQLPPESGSVPPARPDDLPEEPRWRLHGGRAAERHARLAPRIRRLLRLGRGVLVLAPDPASLRAAWADLSGLAAACGTRALLYSGALSAAQREHAWNLIGSGEALLVVGSALSLSAPFPDLGLIAVQEEGSDAHKLLSGSRAFVPDVARRLAEQLETPLVYLGAVPAAETVGLPGVVLPPPRSRLHVLDYSAPQQQPELGPLSSVHLKPGDLGYPLSHDLARVLRQVQGRGRQAALLAPRRGYSALLRCPRCEHTPGCPHCDVSLRFHQDRRALHCHQCGYETGMPERCDRCGEQMWQARGPGTEWIAAEVQRLLPGFPVYRYDKDRQDDLSALDEGGPGVVVGTQALLSLDAPPNLALIGVTLADTWLNVSDFRAGERYHRLLRQLLAWHPDRAPLTVVQTFQAGHPALLSVLNGETADLYPQAECRARRDLGYPPHRQLAQVEVAARDRERAASVAQELADLLHGAGATAPEVLGPAPAPLSRVKGVYPYQLLLRARDEERLSALLNTLDRRFSARVRVDLWPR